MVRERFFFLVRFFHRRRGGKNSPPPPSKKKKKLSGPARVLTLAAYQSLNSVKPGDYYYRFDYLPNEERFKPEKVPIYCRCAAALTLLFARPTHPPSLQNRART